MSFEYLSRLVSFISVIEEFEMVIIIIRQVEASPEEQMKEDLLLFQ